MFTHAHTVKLHDTDCYGIIFFANQFRICHDAFQAALAEFGLPLKPDRASLRTLMVIVHAECDYATPIVVGDVLRVALSLAHTGTSSFTLRYDLTNQAGIAVGTGKTVHVTIDATTNRAVPIPPDIAAMLAKI